MPTLNFKPIQHPGLILDRNELDAVKEKVRTSPWAKAAFDDLIADADRWLSEEIRIPDRKGQWSHYYACSDDGARLQTVSDTEHRCPACGRIYTGEPYDSVVTTGRHNRLAQAARDLGLAYQLTGQADYLKPARQIVLGYADRYLSFPLVDRTGKPGTGLAARVFGTNLAEACWLVPMCWAYDLIAESLTEPERAHVCDDFLRPSAIVVGRRNLQIHNIRCWMNSAKGCAALCCGDGELAYEAIRSDYGLENQLAQGILDDGLWWECSWGYHLYTMSALWSLTEAVRHIGIDVYTEQYKTFFDAPLNFALPGLYLPPLNDSGQGRPLTGGATEPYEIAYARWQDPRYAGLLETGDRKSRLALCFGLPELHPEPPEMRQSVNFHAAGVAILRDGADEPTVVTLDYGPHGGGHGHPDKLGIILHGAGRVMAPDPGSIQYGVPLHLEWFKTTMSHNTVLVDRTPQEACTGKLLAFRTDGEAQMAAASADDAYPGVRFRRTIALLNGGIVIDLCELDSDEDHVYDWVHHNRGEFSSPLPLRDIPSPLGDEHGYQHVRSPRLISTDVDWTARWHDGDAGVCLAMIGAPGTEVIAGIGPTNPPPETLPMVIVRRRGKCARFASVFAVYRGEASQVQISVDDSRADAFRVQVQVGDDARKVDLPRNGS